MTPQPLNRPCGVDVLSVIKESARLLYLDVADEGAACDRLLEAKAKVAELIDAAKEYERGTECHVSSCVYCHDNRTRLRTALAAMEGQS